MSEPTTHFGYQEVPESRKAGLVREVFDSVVDKYDLMNDLMSLGAHRLWKQFTVQISGVRAGDHVLDVAAGSGDLALLMSNKVGKSGSVTLTDINESMLQRGRARMIDQGKVGNIRYVQSDAEALPFDGNCFDCVCIGFGLRNVTDQQKALNSMYRCLVPGGRLLVLEFSRPVGELFKSAYDTYSFRVVPSLGKLVAGDEGSYRYLVESIRKHPSQAELETMITEAGFERVGFNNLAGGIVAVHTGFKY